MRYPMTSEAARDPQRYARQWGDDPVEIEEETFKARRERRKAIRIIRCRPQVTWAVYQGGCCNPDGVEAPYFPKGVTA